MNVTAPSTGGNVATTSGVTPGSADPVVAAQAKYAKEVNSYVNEYIRFADLKAGATLTLTLAVGGALGTAIPKLVNASNTNTAAKTFLAVLFLIAAIAVVLTVIFSAIALTPRVPATGVQSLNSFPDIAGHEPEAYAAQIGGLTERDITKNLAVHNVILSRVATKKFDAITVAVRSLIALLFIGFFIIVLHVLTNT